MKKSILPALLLAMVTPLMAMADAYDAYPTLRFSNEQYSGSYMYVNADDTDSYSLQRTDTDTDGDDFGFKLIPIAEKPGYFYVYNVGQNLFVQHVPQSTNITFTDNEALACEFVVSTNLNDNFLIQDTSNGQYLNAYSGGYVGGWAWSSTGNGWAASCSDETALQTLKANVRGLTELNRVISEASENLWTYQWIDPLITSADQMRTNAFHNDAEGGVANLIDKNTTTNFHSTYASGRVPAGQYHNLVFTFDNEDARTFTFRYYSRTQNKNNRPVEIKIYGSKNGGSTFDSVPVTITRADGLGLWNQYGTVVFTMPDVYNALKFEVTATINLSNGDEVDGATCDGVPFFTYSECQLYPYDCADCNYIYSAEAQAKITAYQNIINTAKAVDMYAVNSVSSVTPALLAELDDIAGRAGTLFDRSTYDRYPSVRLYAHHTGHKFAYVTPHNGAQILGTTDNMANATTEFKFIPTGNENEYYIYNVSTDLYVGSYDEGQLIPFVNYKDAALFEIIDCGVDDQFYNEYISIRLKSADAAYDWEICSLSNNYYPLSWYHGDDYFNNNDCDVCSHWNIITDEDVARFTANKALFDGKSTWGQCFPGLRLITSASQLSSTFGTGDAEGNLSSLIDDDITTIWHSNWQGGDTDYHSFTATFDNSECLTEFEFYYQARPEISTNTRTLGRPAVMWIYGSTDGGVTFTDEKIVELTTSNGLGDFKGLVEFSTGGVVYNAFKFEVRETTAPSITSNSYPYFNYSEFNLMPKIPHKDDYYWYENSLRCAMALASNYLYHTNPCICDEYIEHALNYLETTNTAVDAWMQISQKLNAIYGHPTVDVPGHYTHSTTFSVVANARAAYNDPDVNTIVDIYNALAAFAPEHGVESYNYSGVFTIYCPDGDRGYLIAVDDEECIWTTGKEHDGAATELDVNNPNHLWSFTGIAGGKSYLYNVGTRKFANAYGSSSNDKYEYSWKLTDVPSAIELQPMKGVYPRVAITGGECSMGVPGMMVWNGEDTPVPCRSGISDTTDLMEYEDGNSFVFAYVRPIDVETYTEVWNKVVESHYASADRQAAAADYLASRYVGKVGYATEEAHSALEAADVASHTHDHAYIHHHFTAYENAERVLPAHEMVYVLSDEEGRKLSSLATVDGDVRTWNFDFYNDDEVTEGNTQWCCVLNDNGTYSFKQYYIPTDHESSAAPARRYAAAAPEEIKLTLNGETEFAVTGRNQYLGQLQIAEGVAPVWFDEQADGTATAITELEQGTEAVTEPVYDVLGRRMASPFRGLNIIGGRKVLVK